MLLTITTIGAALIAWTVAAFGLGALLGRAIKRRDEQVPS